jgi:pilus assembly protein CpaF
MKDPVTTFEVHQQGQKSRFFRFVESQITIGFSRRCQLSLEPSAEKGPEIQLIVHPDLSCLLHPTSIPGAFSLNGNPCAQDTPVKVGDEIIVNSCRLTIRQLPSADTAPEKPGTEPRPAKAPAAGVQADGVEPPDAETKVADGDASEAETKAASPDASEAETRAASPDALEAETRAASPDALEAETKAATNLDAAPPAIEIPKPKSPPPAPSEEKVDPNSKSPTPASSAEKVDAKSKSPPPAPSTEKAPAPASEKPAASPQKSASLSYLYLFFAPIKAYLEDDDVAEVMINGPRQIFIERKGKLAAVPEVFANEQSLEAAVMNVARSVGRFFDKDNPRLDARLPDGSRVHAVKPPLCRAGTVVAIRKFRKEKLTIRQLIEFGSLSEEAARMLDIIVKMGKNLIVSGATSSGKTSVLNVLSTLIPPHERILVLEDASELQLQQPHAVCFETRKADEYGKGEVTIRDLVHSSLRLRPDRLVVGEIRSGEALDLLQAMNTGHDGSMSTIHANSARDSLSRLETCALFSGIEIPLSALREQVGSAIHIVVQTARLSDGTRKITGLTEVLGLKDGMYHTQDIMLYRTERLGEGGKIIGRHAFTGYQPTFLAAAQQRGLDISGLCVA